MTPSGQIFSKLLFHPSLECTESVDNKKNQFWPLGAPANRPPIWVFQLKKLHFLKNSRIQKFFFIIIFGGAWSPGGVRLSIRPVWSLTLPVIFEIPHCGFAASFATHVSAPLLAKNRLKTCLDNPDSVGVKRFRSY